MSSGIKDEYFDKALADQELVRMKEHMMSEITSSSLVPKSVASYYGGKIIVLEGLDRVGKSTQLEILKAEFEKAGAKVLTVHFPSGSRIGDVIYRELNEHRQSMTEEEIWVNHLCAHFAITRERIIPALDQNYVVIADRWISSAIVYNGMTADAVPTDQIAFWEKKAVRDLTPEMYLFFQSYSDQLNKPFLQKAYKNYERFFFGLGIQWLHDIIPAVYSFGDWRDRGIETTSIDIFARLAQHALESIKKGD